MESGHLGNGTADKRKPDTDPHTPPGDNRRNNLSMPFTPKVNRATRA
jgi:hypothetical protein